MAVKYSLWNLLKKEESSLALAELTAVNYYKWLKMLCMSMFEWSGLPKSINLEYLEEALFTHGKILFFKDSLLGHLALTCIPVGMNVYGEPTAFQVNVPGYQSKENIKAAEAVLIKNNQLTEPTSWMIGAFAGRLAETERTIAVNLNAQKTPILLLVEDGQNVLTLKNAYKKIEDGVPVILADKATFSTDSVKSINTEAPYIIDKLDTHKMNLWNEALTFLGINNTNTEKRERLITDEVNANQQHVKLSAHAMLLTRQEAVRKINSLFGLQISVKLKSFEEFLPEELPFQDTDPEEGEADV